MLERSQNAVSIFGQLIGLGALLRCYFESPTSERTRGCVGIEPALVLPGAYRLALDSNRLLGQPAWPMFDILGTYPWELFQILLPFALGYAIIRHRLFDIEFVLSRTLVYALLIIAALDISPLSMRFSFALPRLERRARH